MIKWREYRSFYYNVDDDNIFCRSLLLLDIRLFFSYKAVHPYQTDIRLHLRQYYLLVITASSSPARPSHFFLTTHTHHQPIFFTHPLSSMPWSRLKLSICFFLFYFTQEHEWLSCVIREYLNKNDVIELSREPCTSTF